MNRLNQCCKKFRFVKLTFSLCGGLGTPDKHVAFQATTDDDIPANGSVIVFDQVTTNLGQGYNSPGSSPSREMAFISLPGACAVTLLPANTPIPICLWMDKQLGRCMIKVRTSWQTPPCFTLSQVTKCISAAVTLVGMLAQCRNSLDGYRCQVS